MASKSFWDRIQLGGDLLGMIPIAGNFIDLANAGISVLRGDLVGAGLRVGAAVPGLGQAVTGAKLAAQGAGKGIKSLLPKGATSGTGKGVTSVTGKGAASGTGTVTGEGVKRLPAPAPASTSPAIEAAKRKAREQGTTLTPAMLKTLERRERARQTLLPALRNASTKGAVKGSTKGATKELTEEATKKSFLNKAANALLNRRMSLQRVGAAGQTLARGEDEEAETGETSEDIRKGMKETAKSDEESMEAYIDNWNKETKEAKDVIKRGREEEAQAPLMGEGWGAKKNELQDKIFDLEGGLEESQEERRKQLGNRLINAMTAAGTANPNYWSKHPDKLQAIIREGKKLGAHSFDEDDVKRVLKANYKKAVQQKKQDIYEADSRKGLDFVQGKIDDWNIQRAIDRKDEVLPAAELRRRGQRMKGLIGEEGYKEKDYQFGGEDIKPQEIESDLKESKKTLEGMDLAENEAYSAWVDKRKKDEDALKKQQKIDEEAYGDALIAKEEAFQKKKEADQKALKAKKEEEKQAELDKKKKRSWKTWTKEEVADPGKRWLGGIEDALVGGGDYR